MAVIRVEIPHNARRVSGTAVPGATLNVYQRGTTTQVDIYDQATGGSVQTQPIVADSSGRWSGYVQPGRHDVKMTVDGVSVTEEWDASPGGAVLSLTDPTSRIIMGRITTNSPGTIVAGTGFTITRNGTGDITINFTTAFSAAPRVLLLANNNSLQISSPTTSSARVGVVNSAGSLAEGTFDFIAIGPS